MRTWLRISTRPAAGLPADAVSGRRDGRAATDQQLGSTRPSVRMRLERAGSSARWTSTPPFPLERRADARCRRVRRRRQGPDRHQLRSRVHQGSPTSVVAVGARPEVDDLGSRSPDIPARYDSKSGGTGTTVSCPTSQAREVVRDRGAQRRKATKLRNDASQLHDRTRQRDIRWPACAPAWSRGQRAFQRNPARARLLGLHSCKAPARARRLPPGRCLLPVRRGEPGSAVAAGAEAPARAEGGGVLRER